LCVHLTRQTEGPTGRLYTSPNPEYFSPDEGEQFSFPSAYDLWLQMLRVDTHFNFVLIEELITLTIDLGRLSHLK